MFDKDSQQTDLYLIILPGEWGKTAYFTSLESTFCVRQATGTSSLSHSRCLWKCTLPFLLSPAEQSQASTSAREPPSAPPPQPTPHTSEENLVHLGWQLKESQRKASRQRTDVQEEKHEKRRGAIDAVANASQRLRTIKATSATVAVRFLQGEGGYALSRVCSCDLSSRPPSLFRINCQNCPGGRRLSGHMNIKRNEEKKNTLFFLCLCLNASERFLSSTSVFDCRGKNIVVNIISTYCLSNDRYVYSNYLIILINVTLVWLCLQLVQWLTTSSEEKQSCSSCSTSCCAAVVSLVHC